MKIMLGEVKKNRCHLVIVLILSNYQATNYIFLVMWEQIGN